VKTLIALLAAGKSSRFNGVKLAQVIDDAGTRLLEDSYQKLKGVSETLDATLIVVLGGHAEQLLALLPDDAKYVVNHDHEIGLSSSIHCAVSYAQQMNADFLLITLADQVAVTEPEYLSLFAAQAHLLRVCVTFDNHLSVPAIFYRDDFDELTALTGDRGAKSILQALEKAKTLQAIEMSSAAQDIDTRIELEHWLITAKKSGNCQNNK
jgi:molybdenum cofactor cytidylyltransferase